LSGRNNRRSVSSRDHIGLLSRWAHTLVDDRECTVPSQSRSVRYVLQFVSCDERMTDIDGSGSAREQHDHENGGHYSDYSARITHWKRDMLHHMVIHDASPFAC